MADGIKCTQHVLRNESTVEVLYLGFDSHSSPLSIARGQGIDQRGGKDCGYALCVSGSSSGCCEEDSASWNG